MRVLSEEVPGRLVVAAGLTLLLGAAVVADAPETAGQAPPATVVTTAQGQASGVVDATHGVTAWLGLPYAAPPVGEWRWRPPQPASSWTGVRKADAFGTSCMQAQPGERLPWTAEYMTQNAVGEDCLNLNVWAPTARGAGPLPVLVWIYGGGFNEGSSAVSVYDGAPLASRGLIVVSLNYRVGVLGGLAHPELSRESPFGVSGNYGILDQVAALRWVQANIAAFGGDPRNVTIVGQSAGGISVAALMRSPLAAGLFARAIGMAGPGLISGTGPGRGGSLGEREAAGAAFGRALGAPTLAALRALPASSFIAPAVNAGNAAPPSWPVDDGHVLPAEAPAWQVPVMVGFTADDIGTTWAPRGPASAPTIEAWRADAKQAYGDDADAFLALYPVATDAGVAAARKAVGRDRARTAMDAWAARQARVSRTVHTYYFDRVTPWPEHPEFGAHHTSEVPYLFRTIGRGRRAWEPIDTTVSDRFAAYVVNFARSGDPNGPGLPRWPAWAAGAHLTMRLGEEAGTMPVAAPGQRTFLAAHMPAPALQPLPVHGTPRARGGVRIDGVLDEATWALAPRVSPMRLIHDPSRVPARPTEAALAWDDANLYVAFACVDPEPWGTFTARDDRLWEQEVVEVFLDPDGDGRRYAEIEVSPGGVVVDLLIAAPGAGGPNARRWDAAGLQSAVRADDHGWTVEIAIPWSSLAAAGIAAAPTAGDQWRVGLYRIERPGGPAKADRISRLSAERRNAPDDRRAAITRELDALRSDDEYSAWSVTRTSHGFHDPERFGYVRFLP